MCPDRENYLLKMNKVKALFTQESKVSAGLGFEVQNLSLFECGKIISNTKSVCLPVTTDVNFTVQLEKVNEYPSFIKVVILFENNADKEMKFTYSIDVFNDGNNNQPIETVDTVSRVLNAKGTVKTYFWLRISSIKTPDDKCNIIVRIKEALPRKMTTFNCNIADGPPMQDLLTEMYLDNNFTDVKFVIGKESLMAHKVVLATRCKVFHSMFVHDTKEKQDGIVEIKDVCMNVFKSFIKYLYTNEVEDKVLEELAEDLMMVADKYNIQCLRSKCESYLCEKMSEENAMYFLLKADKFNFAALKQCALFLIKANPKTVQSPAFEVAFQCPSLREEIMELLIDDVNLITGINRAISLTSTENSKSD